MLMKFLRRVAISALFAACAPIVEAQAPAGSILHIEIDNVTLYVSDCPQIPNWVEARTNSTVVWVRDLSPALPSAISSR
jgi:hypothetical protein